MPEDHSTAAWTSKTEPVCGAARNLWMFTDRENNECQNILHFFQFMPISTSVLTLPVLIHVTVLFLRLTYLCYSVLLDISLFIYFISSLLFSLRLKADYNKLQAGNQLFNGLLFGSWAVQISWEGYLFSSVQALSCSTISSMNSFHECTFFAKLSGSCVSPSYTQRETCCCCSQLCRRIH